MRRGGGGPAQRPDVIALLEFQTAVEEIFDVQLLPGLRFPEILGFQKDTIDHTFVVPHENEKAADDVLPPREGLLRLPGREPP